MRGAAPGRRCQRVTRAGEQCKRGAASNSVFCWIHYPRGYNWLPTVVGIAIAVVVSAYLAHHSEDVTLTATHVAKSRCLPRVTLQPATIKVGPITVIVPQNGTPVALFGPDPQFFFRLGADGSVLVSGDLKRPDGSLVGTIRDSELDVGVGLGYDINYDDSALEVVDPSLFPVLQVLVTPDTGVIAVRYVAYKRVNGSIVAEIGDAKRFLLNADLDTALKQIASWHRLFKYPGYKNLGKRE
jgi:hypothetical protein